MMRKIYPMFFFFAFFLILILELNGFFITVESNSMQPALSRGDIAYIVRDLQYAPGDVIALSYNNQTYIHRIALSDNRSYRTKGDASLNLDFWAVENKDILGKMAFKIPRLGKINLWLAGL